MWLFFAMISVGTKLSEPIGITYRMGSISSLKTNIMPSEGSAISVLGLQCLLHIRNVCLDIVGWIWMELGVWAYGGSARGDIKATVEGDCMGTDAPRKVDELDAHP